MLVKGATGEFKQWPADVSLVILLYFSMSCLTEVCFLAPVESSVIWLDSDGHVADIPDLDSTKKHPLLFCYFISP